MDTNRKINTKYMVIVVNGIIARAHQLSLNAHMFDDYSTKAIKRDSLEIL